VFLVTKNPTNSINNLA